MKFLKLPSLLLAGTLGFGSCTDHKKEAIDPALDISFDAAYIVNGESNNISVVDLSSNEVKATIKLGETSTGGHAGHGANNAISWPHHVAINPSKTHLAIGVPGMDLSEGHGTTMAGMKGRIVVVNAITGEILQNLELPVMNHNAAYSPDGTEIWTSQMTEEGKVLVYDAATLVLKSTIPVEKYPAEITFSANGESAFVANGGSNSVTAIKVSDKSILASIPVGEEPVGAWPGSNNKMYVDNEHGKSISVIDVATLTVEETVDLGFMPAMAHFDGNLGELWVTDAENGRVVWYERINNTWTQKGALNTGIGAHGIAFSDEGSLVYITNQMAENVTIVNASTKQKVKNIQVGKKPNGITIKN